jgi:glycosyltransferase involved in cell wall biosynthesis
MQSRPEILKQLRAEPFKREISLPLASVVIINLNQGHYLLDCIYSVLNQSYKNIEIILQDGGSSDDSMSILKGYPQIDVVSEKDLSSGHAFAKGAERAKGDFIFFLNSSDGFYSENWIENAMAELRMSDDISMVTGNVVGVDSDSTLNSYVWPKTQTKSKSSKTNFYSWLFDGFGFTPITFGIKATVFRSCSASVEQFSNSEDPNPFDFFWYFSEKFFSQGFISLGIDEIASFVRIHTDRVDDSSYLSRQLEQLNNFITRFRRSLLFGLRRYNFVDSEGKQIENGPVKIFELWRYFIQAKVRHLFGKLLPLKSPSKI